MMLNFLAFLLVACALAQVEDKNCVWTASDHTLDLEQFVGQVITAFSGGNTYLYSVCSNDLICDNNNGMVTLLNNSNTHCNYLAKWDNGTSGPAYNNVGGVISWEWYYGNGQHTSNCDYETLLFWVCSSSPDISAYAFVTSPCLYEYQVSTSYACGDDKPKIEGPDISQFVGKVIKGFDREGNLYMYTPFAENVLKCPNSDTQGMIIRQSENDCIAIAHLTMRAKHEETDNSVMLEYPTGDSDSVCPNGRLTIVNWVCDLEASEPVLKAIPLNNCEYKIIIGTKNLC